MSNLRQRGDPSSRTRSSGPGLPMPACYIDDTGSENGGSGCPEQTARCSRRGAEEAATLARCVFCSARDGLQAGTHEAGFYRLGNVETSGEPGKSLRTKV